MKIKDNPKFLRWFEFFSYFIFSSPILILFFNSVLNNYALSMTIYAAKSVSCTLLEIPFGIISDRIGRKKIMVLGAITRLSCFILWSISYSFVPLLLGAVIGGASDALASGNNDALLYDSLCVSKQKKSYHKIYAGITSYYQFALFLGSLIGAFIAFYSMRLAIVLNILPLMIALIISLIIIEPRHKKLNETTFIKQFIISIKNLWNNRRLRYVALGDGLNYGLNESAYSFNSVFISQFVPVWALGIFKSLGHLMNSFGAHLSNCIARKIGINNTAGYGLVTDNFMNIISVLCNSILTPIVRLASPLSEGVYSPAINTIIQNEIPNNIRATTLSVTSIFSNLCYSGAAIFIGYLADITSPYWALLIAYSIALLVDSLVFIGLKYNSIIISITQIFF